jgi:4-amino-4-deoxy-L-arabinose transferase-like glycosyltransferase
MDESAKWPAQKGTATLSLRVEILLLLLIVVLAATLRMGWPGLTEFKADEARLTTLALELADGSHFPVQGISSSVGIPNFPMSVWLYALPLFLWQHVLAPTFLTGLLNTLAVVGCYWLVRRYWGQEAALVAALLFAASPWAIQHSRKIWAQNLLPFWVMAWAVSGALAFVESRRRFIVVHLFCLAVVAQIHFAGFALVPATLLLMLIFRRRVAWRLVFVGSALALLTALPFAISILRESNGVLPSLPATGSPSVSWVAARYVWLLSTGQEIHALAGAERYRAFLGEVAPLTWASWLWGLLIVSGIVYLAWQAWDGKGQRREVSLLLLVWGGVPLISFSLGVLPVALHYLLPIYPVPYIAVGALVAGLTTAWRRLLQAVVVVSAGAQVWLWVSLLFFLGREVTPGAFGTPLALQLQVVSEAKAAMTVTGAAEIIVAGVGNAPLTDAFPAVYEALLYDVPHRFADARHTALFPATPTVVLLDPAAGAAASLYKASAGAVHRIPLRVGEGALEVLTLTPDAKPAPDVTLDAPTILTNWAAWFGYDQPMVHQDGTATWQVHWYTGEATDEDFHIFNHLVDANGELLSQADTAAFPAGQWQQGDAVVSIFDLPWPSAAAQADDLTMRVGMYTYPDLTPVEAFDVAGNRAGDAVVWPLTP